MPLLTRAPDCEPPLRCVGHTDTNVVIYQRKAFFIQSCACLFAYVYAVPCAHTHMHTHTQTHGGGGSLEHRRTPPTHAHHIPCPAFPRSALSVHRGPFRAPRRTPRWSTASRRCRPRARPRRQFVRPPTHSTPDSIHVRESAPLFLKQQCDRALCRPRWMSPGPRARGSHAAPPRGRRRAPPARQPAQRAVPINALVRLAGSVTSDSLPTQQSSTEVNAPIGVTSVTSGH